MQQFYFRKLILKKLLTKEKIKHIIVLLLRFKRRKNYDF